MALNKAKIAKDAEKYIRKNHINKAIGEYEKWLKENPKDWNTVRQVADLHARVGENEEAIKKYNIVADHYRRDGFNVRAIATHKLILRLDPQNELAMRTLAELQTEQGLLMEAKSQFQTLVDLYMKTNRRGRAEDVFKKLAEIDPSDLKVRYKFAEFLGHQGKPDKAIAEYIGIAEEFINKGMVDEAEKILEKGMQVDAASVAIRVKYAQTASLQGNHAKSVQMLEDAKRASPDNPEVLGRLGEAYLAAGNTGAAAQSFQRLIQLQPDKPENVIRLADLKIAESQLDGALEQLTPLVDRLVGENEAQKATNLLQRVLSKGPHHIRTLLKLAEVHTILKQESGRISAYDSLCEAYNQAGDFEKAAQVAEQLIELEPENSQHQDRLKFLKSRLPGPGAAPAAPASRQPAPVATPTAANVMDQDLPALTDMPGMPGIEEAVSASFASDLVTDERAAPVDASPMAELGEVVELTQEDEEHIKEKLTEADVFVRYGLVDKAIGQLLDVLESFRFHTEAREKLVEIYKDQGMNREAAEQMLQLSHVYHKLGQADAAAGAREEATTLNPALAAQAASAELTAEEEIELTLAPETESDLGDVGIEVGAPLEEDVLSVDAMDIGADMVEDIAIDLDAPVPGDIELSIEEPPVEVVPAAPVEPAAVVEPELPPEVPIVEEEIPAEVDFGVEEIAVETPEPEVEIAIDSGIDDLGAPIEERAEEFTLEDAALGGEEFDMGDSDGTEIDLDSAVEEAVPAGPMTAAPVGTSELEEEFAVDIGEEEEFSIDIPSEEAVAGQPVEPAQSEQPEQIVEEELPVSSVDGDDILIDIPSDEPEVPEPVFEETSQPVEVADIAEDPLETETLVGPTSEVDVPIFEEIPTVLPPSAPAEPVQPAASTPSPPAPEPPPAPAGPLGAELEEVDEYIALGLYEDARDTLRELLKKNPGDAAVVAKIDELGFSSEQLQREVAAPAASLVDQDSVSAATEASEPALAVSPEDLVASDALTELVTGDSAGVHEPAVRDQPTELEELVGSTADVVSPSAIRSAGGDESFVDLASELSEEIFGTKSVESAEKKEAEGPLTDPGLREPLQRIPEGRREAARYRGLRHALQPRYRLQGDGITR